MKKWGIEMEIMQVHQMITDCWRLYKEYYSKDLTDQELKEIYEKANSLTNKYERDRFTSSMIAAVVNELGDIHKQKYGRIQGGRCI